MSEPKRYDNFQYETEGGEYVRYEDYARLKAEVERLTSDIQMEKENEDRLVREWQRANNEVYGLQRQVAALIDDQTRLKAEVERLKMEQRLKAVPVEAKLMDSIAKLQTENDHLEANNERMSREYCDLAEDHCRLKQQINSLTKAGDEIAYGYQNGDWNERKIANRVSAWNAAKEGKQP